MVKKYKLLNDLPGVDAGTLISADSIYSIPVVVKSPLGRMHYSFPTEMLELYPEWFEEVKVGIYSEKDLIDAYNYGLNDLPYKDLIESINTKKH